LPQAFVLFFGETSSIIINNTLLNIIIYHSHEHIHDVINNIYYKLSFNKKRDDIIYVNLNYFELNNLCLCGGV
jgi:hypothetical protein